MKVEKTSLEGVVIITPDVYEDERGFFMETYNRKRYEQAGVKISENGSFVQDNLSYSVRGTLRGLHFQKNKPQAKLVQVICGEIFDVAVDIRTGSPTFGQWIGVTLSEKNHRQMFVPEGFAHGFCVLSQTAHFLYKCSAFYDPEDEDGVLWSDPAIGIDWPVKTPIISPKDQKFVHLEQT
ncbi:dTDP-4-dehydrorhamnose 3,5-epimerase [Desulfococcaceae bacterium HSG9]|nr:dTDP-4-dehydrorhamnose 3,5-epimerase [Desulfococcaceae bacterium HSG9]